MCEPSYGDGLNDRTGFSEFRKLMGPEKAFPLQDPGFAYHRNPNYQEMRVG
jgi:hypothetical protein